MSQQEPSSNLICLKADTPNTLECPPLGGPKNLPKGRYSRLAKSLCQAGCAMLDLLNQSSKLDYYNYNLKTDQIFKRKEVKDEKNG